MVRFALIALAGLVLAACSGAKIDANDPWKDLYPWDETRKDIQTTENGVKYVVIRKGEGTSAHPGPMDEVTVNYAGRLATDGKEFDSSYGRGEPATFPLSRVIPGWTEGLQEMQVGDEFMFYIPAEMGYGAEGAGEGEIPPNSDLMFRVELLDIIPPTKPDEEAWTKMTPWNSDAEGVVGLKDGIEYVVLESGEASEPMPKAGDLTLVHFEGRLDDGTVVGSSMQPQFPGAPAQPAVFPVDDLLPGWAAVMKAMHKGDRWLVRFPPSQLYGDDGYGDVPPNSAMTFEIVLKDVLTPPPQMQRMQEPAGETAEAPADGEAAAVAEAPAAD